MNIAPVDIISAFQLTFAPTATCVLMLTLVARRFGWNGIALGGSAGLSLAALFHSAGFAPFSPAIFAISTVVFALFGGTLMHRFLEQCPDDQANFERRSDKIGLGAFYAPAIAAGLSAWILFATFIDHALRGLWKLDPKQLTGAALGFLLTAAIAATLSATSEAHRFPSRFVDAAAAFFVFSYASLQLVSAIGGILE